MYVISISNRISESDIPVTFVLAQRVCDSDFVQDPNLTLLSFFRKCVLLIPLFLVHFLKAPNFSFVHQLACEFSYVLIITCIHVYL